MLTKNLIIFFYFIFFCFFSLASYGAVNSENKFSHPFYIGVTGGFGSTTWSGLVPAKENQNFALNISTPTFVKEGGGVWGFLVGYEFIPYFALETSYLHYPHATVSFDPFSLYAFDHGGATTLETHTETISLMGKFMIIIPHTEVRAFSSLGAAMIHRADKIADRWRVTPAFDAGVNYNFTPHVMGEFGAEYVAGYGESELDPAEDFVPFLYSIFIRLAYRF